MALAKYTCQIRLVYAVLRILIVAGGSSNQKHASTVWSQVEAKEFGWPADSTAFGQRAASEAEFFVGRFFGQLFHDPRALLESCIRRIHTRFRCRCLRPSQAAEWPQDDMAVAFGQDTSKAEGFFLDMLRAAALSKSSFLHSLDLATVATADR